MLLLAIRVVPDIQIRFARYPTIFFKSGSSSYSIVHFISDYLVPAGFKNCYLVHPYLLSHNSRSQYTSLSNSDSIQ